MAFCSAGDLSIYIRKRGQVAALSASNQGLAGEPAPGQAQPAQEEVLYPHPKEGGLNESVVRCFLGQLGPSSLTAIMPTRSVEADKICVTCRSERDALPAIAERHASRHQATGKSA